MKVALGLLLLVTTACASPTKADPAITRLTLRVVNAQTSGPLGQVTVAATTDDGKEIGHDETSVSGFVLLDVPRDTRLWIDLNAVGFKARREPYLFTQPAVETAVSLTPLTPDIGK